MLRTGCNYLTSVSLRNFSPGGYDWSPLVIAMLSTANMTLL